MRGFSQAPSAKGGGSKAMMKYKGYIGHVEFDDESGVFHGEVINTRGVITFQGKSVAELKREFKSSVDVYLAFCKRRGKEPDKPFSGKFVLRIDPDLHRKVYVTAKHEGKSINNWVAETLKKATT